MARDRMFHVIVLGGMGLVACGGSVASNDHVSTDAQADAFPSEGTVMIDGGFIDAGDARPPSDGSSIVDVFPAEGPAILDAFTPKDASAVLDAFPEEGTAPQDARVTDASPSTDGSAEGGLHDAQVLDAGDAFPPVEGPPPPH
jgi:hypothetical protein